MTAIDALTERGWRLADIGRRFGAKPHVVKSWRDRGNPPARVQALADEYLQYPPAAQMFADLDARGWGPAPLAHRIGASAVTVQGWLTGAYRCTDPHVMPAVYAVWKSGERREPSPNRARRGRSQPERRGSMAPQSWDPHRTRPCITNPRAWDGEDPHERSIAAQICQTCPVLDACRAKLERDLAAGTNISGVIAGQYVPHRDRRAS